MHLTCKKIVTVDLAPQVIFYAYDSSWYALNKCRSRSQLVTESSALVLIKKCGSPRDNV